MIHVVAFNSALPDVDRKTVELFGPHTVEGAVSAVLPDAAEHVLAAARVTIHNDDGQVFIPRSAWRFTHLRDGVRVAVSLPPEASAFLGLVGAISSAITSGIYYAGFTGLGVLGTNAIFLGVAAGLGALAVAGLNALLPEIPEMNTQQGEDTYSLSGWRNTARPGEPIPLPLGRIRVSPMFAAQPYTEVVGDDQYVRALFCFGYGPLKISEIRIGDTPIDDLIGVQCEVREGRPDDDPVSLVRRQVLEHVVGLELEGLQPPTDEFGNPIEGGLEEQPQIVTTEDNTTGVTVILNWPNGLHRISKNDGDIKNWYTNIRVRIRPSGQSDWQVVEEIEFLEGTKKGFFRSLSIPLPQRGKWDVEVCRVEEKPGAANITSNCNLHSVQSIRPEYPVNSDKPLAMLSLRIKASYQIRGTVDDLTAIVERYVSDWDGSDWVEATSVNPASAYVYALMGNHNRKPARPEEIDWDTLRDWHEYCTANNLTYSHNHISRVELKTMLVTIAQAGRAAPRHNGSKWSVIIDRERAFVSRHISPRNSRDFRGERSYFEAPDGLRVKFNDEAEDFEEREIVVPWIGKTLADIEIAAQHTIRGCTNADEIQRRAFRYMLEAELRRDTWSCVMFDLTEVVERGDRVKLSHYVLNDQMVTGRVLAVSGQRVVLDETVTMVDGETYGISWQYFDAADTTGNERIAELRTIAGETNSLEVVGQTLPAIGDLVCFGRGEMITEDAVVRYIEPGSEGARVIHMTNAANEMDAMTAAFEPEEFNGIYGEIVGTDTVPLAPRFAGVSTVAAEGEYGSTARTVNVSAGADPFDTAPISAIRVQHRLSGSGTWGLATISGASGTTGLAYEQGDQIELQILAARDDGVTGPPSASVTYTVGADLAALPVTPDTATMSAVGSLGFATIEMRHGDSSTVAIEVFRTAQGATLDTDADSLGVFELAAGQTIAVIDGDTSRDDLLDGLDYSGAAGATVAHPVPLVDGAYYRGGISISGSSAGSVTVSLTGSGVNVDSAALSGDALHLISLQTGAGLTEVSLTRSSDFDGSVDLVLFEETSATAPQGVQEYRFAAQNEDGLFSAVSDPMTTPII